MNAEAPKQQTHSLSDGTTLSVFDGEQLLSREVWFRQTGNGLETAPAPTADWQGAEH